MTSSGCRHCGARYNAYGDCSAKCEGHHKDNSYASLYPIKPNPLLELLEEREIEVEEDIKK